MLCSRCCTFVGWTLWRLTQHHNPACICCLFILLTSATFSRRHTLVLSLSLCGELLPYTHCHANSLILVCMPSFSQPALLCRRISEQEYSLPPHGNPSVTVTNVLSVSELGILTNRCAQNSDILQRLNKVKFMNQTGSFYALCCITLR